MVDLACTTGRTGDRASSARHGHHWEDGGRERVRQVVRSQEEGAGGDLVAVIARRYGDLPVRFFQATLASPRPRIWTDVIEVVTDAAGCAVLLRGWVQSN